MFTSEHNWFLQADEDVHPNIYAHIQWLEEALSMIKEDVECRIKNSHFWLEKDTLIKSMPGAGRLNSRKIATLVGVAPLKR